MIIYIVQQNRPTSESNFAFKYSQKINAVSYYTFFVLCRFIDNLTSSRIVNEAKTETNIDQNKVDNITYFGRSIQVSSKEISNSYSFESRYEIRYRFKFMSYKRVLEPKA